MNPQQMYYQQFPEQTKKGFGKRKLLLIVLGVMVLLTALLAVISLISGSQDQRSASSFISLIAAGDSTKSFQMLSQDAKLTTSEKSWESYVRANKDFYSGSVSKAYEQKLGDSMGSEFGFNIKKNDATYRATIVTTQEGNETKIYSAEITRTSL